MYLKALEISGFKSFPERTRLTFGRDITAIVGPNGSGKSNISDAILWVMGEQSTRTLRGGKMQDVIFGGTARRPSLGVAQVSLVLDNSAGLFDIDADEVTITRKYYRSGESEYYINRRQVRLRDVYELLMDTGMGRDGYSIIGQGRIAEIVSGKSSERREVLEEAAGISRYRYRMEESERRLQRTEENLLRINDKIEELELQVNPLREQAEVAKRFLALRDELRVSEVSLWMNDLDALRAQAGVTEGEYSEIKASLEAARRELEGLYSRSEVLTERMRARDVEAESRREELTKTLALTAEQDARAAALHSRIDSAQQSIERMRGELSEQSERVSGIEAQIAEHAQRLTEITAESTKLSEEAESSKNVAEGRRMRIANRERELNDLTDELTKQIVELNSVDSRINILSEMEREYEGFGNAVKTVMRESRRGSLRGVHGTVSELLRTSERTALAIETALGGAIQNIVVDRQEDGKRAIEFLQRRNAGRATFLPLDAIRGGRLDDVPGEDEGCVGLAVELVEFDALYASVFENLLGRTLVAETLTDAIAISRRRGGRVRIVTLDGQIIHSGGSMTGGSAARNAGILSRRGELERLQAGRGKLAKRRDELSARSEELKRTLTSARYELEVATEELAGINSRIASLEAEKRTTENASQQLRLLLAGLTGDSEQREHAINDTLAAIESYERELAGVKEKTDELNAEAEKLKAAISEATSGKLAVEGERTRTDKAAQEKNAAILELERSLAKAEQKKLAAEMEEKQLTDKLWDSYELSHTAAEAIRQPVESRPKAARHISELRREMTGLGNPNIGAIDEYKRVSERWEFLTGQRDDVEKAKAELVGIIADITEEMRAIFSREFAAINESFKRTFTDLFGGGSAELTITPADDILGGDIDIRVQPPGKALTTLSLLSGGETAFVAIALYFAIIKVRPTPFCVMDEIEAALDEANVNRFARQMRELAGKTQFIVITHRRGTMEEADELYGVTMQEKGVSKVIELDLDEAARQIQEDENGILRQDKAGA